MAVVGGPAVPFSISQIMMVKQVSATTVPQTAAHLLLFQLCELTFVDLVLVNCIRRLKLVSSLWIVVSEGSAFAKTQTDDDTNGSEDYFAVGTMAHDVGGSPRCCWSRLAACICLE